MSKTIFMTEKVKKKKHSTVMRIT